MFESNPVLCTVGVVALVGVASQSYIGWCGCFGWGCLSYIPVKNFVVRYFLHAQEPSKCKHAQTRSLCKHGLGNRKLSATNAPTNSRRRKELWMKKETAFSIVLPVGKQWAWMCSHLPPRFVHALYIPHVECKETTLQPANQLLRFMLTCTSW